MSELASIHSQLRLGHPLMDATHDEFWAHLHAAAGASGDEFSALFNALLAHTQQHFAQEEHWMAQSQYTAYKDHKAEHDHVLGELTQLYSRVIAGSPKLAKAFIQETLPAKFNLHLATRDAALALHLTQPLIEN